MDINAVEPLQRTSGHHFREKIIKNYGHLLIEQTFTIFCMEHDFMVLMLSTTARLKLFKQWNTTGAHLGFLKGRGGFLKLGHNFDFFK